MTISTYAELQTELISLSHRSDLATILPTLIGLAEAEVFRELSLRGIETSATGATSGETLAIPADADSVQRIEIESGGYKYTLSYTSPNGIETLTGSTDRPQRFLFENGSIRLIPAPNGSYTYTIFYVPKLTALSDSNPTNWLLTNHHDVYVKASLVQIHKHTRNAEQAALVGNDLVTALGSVQRSDERKRFPSTGGMQIKPRGVR